MENIFCECFKANNLSRIDKAFNASKKNNTLKLSIDTFDINLEATLKF